MYYFRYVEKEEELKIQSMQPLNVLLKYIILTKKV